ncbi:MAG TPA: hypothetical protein DEB06_04010 [Phycisphaerales bacterium]|nr:hypothetical protein [Phycisphaerales bacterium]
MFLNALVIVFILVSALLWGGKARGYGLFSAFLAFACAIVAGAIAFGLWEVVAGALLNAGRDNSSFVGGLLQDTAWGLGLLLPYLASLIVLRLIVDSLVKGNLDFSETTNMAGGIVFGGAAAFISAGVFVVAAGYTRLPPRLLGYQPIADSNGNLVYESKLWVPVDGLTVSLYERLSVGALRNGTPLARVRPAAAEGAGMQRMTFKGQTRSALLPEQFKVVGRYTVEANLEQLLQDDFNPGRTQLVVGRDGRTPPPAGSRLLGVVVNLDAGAKEKGGNIIVTPGQVRLVVAMPSGEATTVHPFAVIAKPDAGSNLPLFRFRFDTRESSIASGAGESSAVFGFEFLVPPGGTPSYLLLKNARAPLNDGSVPESTFPTTLARDDAVRNQSIFRSFGAGGGASPLDTSGSRRIAVNEAGSVANLSPQGVFPGNRAFNKTVRGGLNVNDDNRVIAGEVTLARAVFEERGLDRNLRVDTFAETPDTRVVIVDLSEAGNRTLFGRAVEAAQTSEGVALVDEAGNRYEPVGFLYDDGSLVTIRFSPDRPLRTIGDAPTLSRTARDQSLHLVFRPTRGVKLVGFAIGNREVYNFRPEGVTLR